MRMILLILLAQVREAIKSLNTAQDIVLKEDKLDLIRDLLEIHQQLLSVEERLEAIGFRWKATETKKGLMP